MINRNFVNMLLNKIRSNSVFKQKLLLGILKLGENQTVDPFSNKMEEHYLGWRIIKKLTNHEKLSGVNDMDISDMYNSLYVQAYEFLKSKFN